MSNQLAFVPELEKVLRPLFKEMYSNIRNIDNYWLFCANWGKYYPSELKSGILFYGRATNGWIDYSYTCDDADSIFSYLFNRDDQMEWMPNNNRRAFVNLLKHVSQNYYQDEWYQYIAWSNVCKIAPDTKNGTPNSELWDEQYCYMVKIMEAELKHLSPKIVVFVTGTTAGEDWESPLYEIDKYKNLKDNLKESIVWGEDARSGRPLTTNGGKTDDTIFIVTDRPEGRPIEPHAKAIIEIINKLTDI